MYKNFLKNIIFISTFCIVHVYGRHTCPFCRLAVNFLEECKIKFNFHDTNDPKELQKINMLLEEENKITKKVPQIFICGKHIGGYSDMMRMRYDGELEKTLNSNKIKFKCDLLEI